MPVHAFFRDRRLRPKATDPIRETSQIDGVPEQKSRGASIRAQETLDGLGYGLVWEVEFEARQPRSEAFLDASIGPISWPIPKLVFAGTPLVNFCS